METDCLPYIRNKNKLLQAFYVLNICPCRKKYKEIEMLRTLNFTFLISGTVVEAITTSCFGRQQVILADLEILLYAIDGIYITIQL